MANWFDRFSATSRSYAVEGDFAGAERHHEHASLDIVVRPLGDGAGTNDVFIGSNGHDEFEGTEGNDTFDLHQGGKDTANGNGGDDLFTMGAQFATGDNIDGGAGNDTISLAGDTLPLPKFTSIENLLLGTGHDYNFIPVDGAVAAGQVLNVLAGALDSSDTLTFNGSSEHDGAFNVTGGAGTDTLTGSTGNDVLSGGDGDDRIHNDPGNDVLYGGIGNDRLGDTSGSDLFTTDNMYGGDGDDIIDGWYGTGLLDGGSGNDTIVGHGIDTIYGGDGNDTLSGGDVLTDAGAGDDIVQGGGGSADALFGGDGTDLLNLTGILTGAHLSAATSGFEQLGSVGVTGDAGANTFDFSGFVLTAGGVTANGDDNDDVLTGTAVGDTLNGDDGSDTLYGGDGGDSLWADSNVTYSGSEGPPYGGLGDDDLYGGSGADFLQGNAGNNGLYGGDDNDTIYADKAGTYAIDGGSGDDLIRVGDADYTGHTATVAGDGLIGGAGFDTLMTYNNVNITGPSFVAEDAGFEHLWIVTVSQIAGDGGDNVLDFSGLTREPGTSFLNLFGGIGNDTLVACDDGGNLNGDAGDDTLTGTAGGDGLYGGADNDHITAAGAADYIEAGEGDNVVFGGSGDDEIYAGVGNDTMMGGADDDQIFSSGGTDTITGGAGADIMGAGGATTFAYAAVSESNFKTHDLVYFDTTTDQFDLWFTVTGVDHERSAGSLKKVPHALNAHHLHANHAAIVHIGDDQYLAVDANGIAGFQKADDLLIQISSSEAHHLSVDNFI